MAKVDFIVNVKLENVEDIKTIADIVADLTKVRLYSDGNRSGVILKDNKKVYDLVKRARAFKEKINTEGVDLSEAEYTTRNAEADQYENEARN